MSLLVANATGGPPVWVKGSCFFLSLLSLGFCLLGMIYSNNLIFIVVSVLVLFSSKLTSHVCNLVENIAFYLEILQASPFWSTDIDMGF